LTLGWHRNYGVGVVRNWREILAALVFFAVLVVVLSMPLRKSAEAVILLAGLGLILGVLVLSIVVNRPSRKRGPS
jgi:hypothetical protein